MLGKQLISKSLGLRIFQIPFKKEPAIIMSYKNKYFCNNKILDKNQANERGDIISYFDNIRYHDDFYKAIVVDMSKNAKFIGVKSGMTGKDIMEVYENQEKKILTDKIMRF